MDNQFKNSKLWILQREKNVEQYISYPLLSGKKFQSLNTIYIYRCMGGIEVVFV